MMYAPMSDVSTFVYVIVKTFYGNRNYYCVCVPIATQLKQVIRLLSESSCENPKLLYNIRLIYTMGGLLELKDHNLTIADYGLKDMSQLLMFS
jgi:tripartite motif-containing protein 9/67